MDHLLPLLLLCSSGVLAEEKLNPADPDDELRLVGGASRCAGFLELKHLEEWRPVYTFHWNLKKAAVFCEHLDCGSAVSAAHEKVFSPRDVWRMVSECVQSKSVQTNCAVSHQSVTVLTLTCSDSVRLLDGTSHCSGRLEVKTNQTNQQWASVCEADFDLQYAEVVCRELGCGAPSVLQGALYGEVQAPMWSAEFQCGGHESALLDCRSSGSVRNSCSPGKAVGLTCSGPDELRLVGGASRCAGTLELKHLEEWRPLYVSDWTLKRAVVFCEHLDCGSLVSVREEKSRAQSVWSISSSCVLTLSHLIDCAASDSFSFTTDLVCSDSVRLLDGTSQCSGRLEVKTNQTNQRWASVCEADFDLQDAEVVCRELGCGAPSVLQGALFGEVQAPMWSAEFQCGGHESALLDCRSSGSVRNSCSPGKAVGLTCSGPAVELRLVGGASRCAGTLELKYQGEWRPVEVFYSKLTTAAVFCEQLDCGSALSIREEKSTEQSVWIIDPLCNLTGSHLIDCATSRSSSFTTELVCSDSVRLLDGTSQCSGRLEVKTNQTNQRWASVCEADFDLQDAEVVCRELGCGAPSVLQGALFGEVQAPMWSAEFQCGGHESALLDCRSSGSVRNSCSPGKAVGLTCSGPAVELRLVGGASRCAGTLELKYQGEWRPVEVFYSKLTTAAVFCEQLDCGSALSIREEKSTEQSVWIIDPLCNLTGSHLIDCATSRSSSFTTELVCSDSVRLLDGTSHCSGRLEVKTNQTNQRWASVCETDFDLQDAEVVCRELGCGAPSVLQGALFGEVQAPMWSAEFQCGGHESVLLDCRSSGSVRNSCSPAKAVGLTCSGPDDELRLVGGASRCAGTLELKHLEEWRPLYVSDWTLKRAVVFCQHLDCGSLVSVREEKSRAQSVWSINPSCFLTGSHLIDCATSRSSSFTTELVCSDSVRLLDGTSHCSGRLEVKTNQTNQQWSSVCEADFDLQDAEVVCRELGCGAPSVLQGALYGEVQAPMWSAEFQCGGHESALLDCRSSGSVRNSCSPGKAVGLTCSGPDDELRLVGGASRCAGTLELKHLEEWRPLYVSDWTLKRAVVFCEHLDCGSLVSVREEKSRAQSVWSINPSCFLTGSHLIDCATSRSSSFTTELVCSDSVRLLDGTSQCSGRLEVKTNQTNQRWASVCETDFDLQGAEVVCRELGCGAPSVLQGALFGEVQAPMWSAEFQCGGYESALLDCRSSGSVRNSCSPAKAVGLTCSGPDVELRLVGGASRCAGTLELKHLEEWRPLYVSDWTLKRAVVFCEHLDCGSLVSIREEKSRAQSVWSINSSCVLTLSHLINCITSASSSVTTDLVCSDLLLQPIISVSSSFVGVSEAQQQGVQVIMGSAFTIGCSIQPQYPGGSFQLTFASSNTSHSQTAVNHSAHFLFPAADPTHRGNYSCVYEVHIFNQNFSSESRLLFLSVSDPTALITRWVLLPLILLLLLLLLLLAALWFHWKTSRGQSVTTQRNMDLSVGLAEGGSADVNEAQEVASGL